MSEQQYYGQEELRKALKALGIHISYVKFRELMLDGIPRIPLSCHRNVYHMPSVLQWLHARQSGESVQQSVLDKIARKAS